MVSDIIESLNHWTLAAVLLILHVDFHEKCVVILPCLNEAKSIGALIGEILPLVETVVVVNDGSTDGTGAIARAKGAHLISHSQSLGKGVALNAGWEWAFERGFEWAIMMDGDGQHSPQDLPFFLKEAASGMGDLIVGNRMSKPEAMPWLRKQVNNWMSKRLSQLTGTTIPDSQCGFRMMRLNSWRALSFTTTHYEIESEMLVNFLSAGLRVRFVPIQTIYRGETSRINPIRDTWRWFCWLWRSNNAGTKRILARHSHRLEHQAGTRV